MSDPSQDDLLRSLLCRSVRMAPDDQAPLGQSHLEPGVAELLEFLNDIDAVLATLTETGSELLDITPADVLKAMAEFNLTIDQVIVNRAMLF